MSELLFVRRGESSTSRPPSTMINSTLLEPIPQSAVPTPAPRESPDPPLEDQLVEGNSSELVDALLDVSSSRRSSLSLSQYPMPGSYFAAGAIPSASGSTTPSGDKPRPAIAIPVSTPDEPVFSAYPPSRSNSKGKGRSFTFPLKPFSLSTPPRRRGSVKDGSTQVESTASARRPTGRRRSSSLTEAPIQATTAEPVQPPSLSPPSSHVKFFRRRRASLGAPSGLAPEYQVQSEDPMWSSMVKQEADRLESPSEQPFTYQQPADSGYTLQSVSTVTTVRPLSSPHITPRRSSLVAPETHSPSHPAEPVFVVPDDMVMPHEPPPRRSSLDLSAPAKEDLPLVHADAQSLLSSSITNTDTSAFSPSTSSQEHPLSSATTSLSRSAKSGQEGSDEKHAALSAIRLQRSLEWEAKQTRRRRRLERRKMAVLELVETEVAYTEDLRTLVQIYLPQLAAMPSISDRTVALVSRNAAELLEFHAQLATQMVDVLKVEQITFAVQHGVDSQIERASRKLAALLVDNVSMFASYRQFCAGSIAAATLVRHITARPDYDSFERRCQIISASQVFVTLQDLLLDNVGVPGPSNRSRLHFRDYLIMPIQRVCRYPLLLNQLASTALTPSIEIPDSDDDEAMDVGTDVQLALSAMRGVAEEADESRRLREAEIKSATILERMEPHHILSPSFIKSLGTCRLIGSLDVLHHHPVIAPLVPPAKVKYLAAFLYRGYLILAKVKKGKVYEAKHFLPLEVFELIDITEGFLPHSVRLTLRDHNFDLAASCEAEKNVWSAALCQARDESVVPPFELPASVSPFAARSRRMSTHPTADVPGGPAPPAAASAVAPPALKRHTLAGAPLELDMDAIAQSNETVASAPRSAPIRTSFSGVSSSSRSSTVLLRRPSTTARLLIDRGLIDVFSESCAQARSKAQMQHGLFLHDMTASPTEIRPRLSLRDSSMLRRRKSFLDSKSSSNIAVSGEIKGAVIPIRHSRSTAGRTRASAARPRSNSVGTANGSANETADETVTYSDFGQTVTGYSSMASGSNSPVPSPEQEPRSQFTSHQSFPFDQLPTAAPAIPHRSLVRRQSKSVADFHAEREGGLPAEPPSRTGLRERTRSTPASPAARPARDVERQGYSYDAHQGSTPPRLVKTLSDPPPPLRPTSYFSIGSNATLRDAAGHEKALASEFGGHQRRYSQKDRDVPDKFKSWSTLRRSMSFLKTSQSIPAPGPELGISNMTPPHSYLTLAADVSASPVALASRSTANLTEQNYPSSASMLTSQSAPLFDGTAARPDIKAAERANRQDDLGSISPLGSPLPGAREWGASYANTYGRGQARTHASSVSMTDRSGDEGEDDSRSSSGSGSGSASASGHSSGGADDFSGPGPSGETIGSSRSFGEIAGGGSGSGRRKGASGEGGSASVPTTPKRKKSMLMRSIGRFTPM